MKEIHHYDYLNTFWDRSRQKNTGSRYLKQSYDSLNGDYEYALKWKIHDTLGGLGSSEDTFTRFYVYNLKEIHHYDYHNTFWDRTRPKKTSSHYLKQSYYDTLIDEYQKFYSGTRRRFGS